MRILSTYSLNKPNCRVRHTATTTFCAQQNLKNDKFENRNNVIVLKNANLPIENKLFIEFISNKNKKQNPTIVSSNGNIYKCKRSGKAIIIKERHDKSGINNGIIKQVSNEYDNEVKILMSLPNSFANRLKLIGYSQRNGEINTIATEYISGKAIDAKHDKLTPKMLSNLYKDLLHLDKAEILHRDLTTYNILLDKNKNLKIIDYGASKTFEDIYNLQKSDIIKYKHPNFLPITNIENFEENMLKVYLTQLINLKDQKDADELLIEHLKLKADYYKNLQNIIEEQAHPNKNTLLKNAKIYENTYTLIKSNKLSDEEVNDIIKIEKLRIDAKHAQKRTRLYNTNAYKNPLTAMYWNTFEGFCTKELINESKKFSEKYNKNEILKRFFDLQKDIGLFHFTEIFKPEYKKNSQILNSQLENLEMPISQNVCNEGVLLAVKDKNNAWCGPAIPIVKIKD